MKTNASGRTRRSNERTDKRANKRSALPTTDIERAARPTTATTTATTETETSTTTTTPFFNNNTDKTHTTHN